MDRNLAMELVRVTEAAALASARFMGRGDEAAADMAAIEAMKKESGVLQIKTRKLSDKCMIEFRDNGTGMDNDTLNKLFEPYFTGKSKGSGLGLTNTQNIILNHKGSIHVKSEPGVGSTFIVMLNFAQEAADEA